MHELQNLIDKRLSIETTKNILVESNNKFIGKLKQFNSSETGNMLTFVNIINHENIKIHEEITIFDKEIISYTLLEELK